MSTDDLVSIADIEAARDHIAPVAHRTPLDTSNTLARLTGANEIRLKLENLQRTGAFKTRGAYNRLSRLDEDEKERGVITISAGNHAQGVAFAAQQLDVDATVVMPTFTPHAKIDATRGYGAEVVVHGEVYDEFYGRAMEIRDERDLMFVHPFNEPAIIAGQGTIGLEIVEDFPAVDTVLVAIGGGGLISGIATALKSHDPDIRVIGVETTGSAHASRSVEANEIIPRDTLDTIAEGIAAGRLGPNTMKHIQAHVDEIVTVDDAAVTKALALLAERAKTVAEAAGAVPTAALVDETADVTGENVVAVVSGGNIGLTEFDELLQIGLANTERYAAVRVSVRNWPASLAAVTETIETNGAELDTISSAPLAPDVPPNRHSMTLGIKGTGRDHLVAVIEALDGRDGIEVTVESSISGSEI